MDFPSWLCPDRHSQEAEVSHSLNQRIPFGLDEEVTSSKQSQEARSVKSKLENLGSVRYQVLTADFLGNIHPGEAAHPKASAPRKGVLMPREDTNEASASLLRPTTCF